MFNRCLIIIFMKVVLKLKLTYFKKQTLEENTSFKCEISPFVRDILV